MKSIKSLINQIWEVPIFYKLLQATLAAGGHSIIKKYLLSEVPKKATKILDQGCGTGEYSLLFGERYTGIDYDSDYINHAKSRYPSSKFIVGSADKMPINSNSFDATFAVGLHHHLTDKQANLAFKEALRVTKKGGKVIIVDAMLPKNRYNFIGLFLRKMDRGGNVRIVKDTVSLIPKNTSFDYRILSSFPFDYLTIVIKK